MRDLFAIAVIALAVVALGIFRLPEEDAIIAAGLRAAAQTAMADEVHPVGIDVTGRKITVSGRVETRADANKILSELRALDGVETVTDELTILPDAAPFIMRLEMAEEVPSAEGFVPRRSFALSMEETLGAMPGALVDALTVATGVPDEDWDDVVGRGVAALALLESGVLSVSDRSISLSGAALVPSIAKQAQALLADLPEGYEVILQLEALDDGRPYRVVVLRDSRMGLRIEGKVPPDVDPLIVTNLLGEAQANTLVRARVSRPAPGFAQALSLGLDAFTSLDSGSLSVSGAETGGSVVLTGGPVPPEVMSQLSRVEDALPGGYALHLALVPADDGVPLAVTAKLDAGRVLLSGKLPADTDLATLESALPGIALSAEVVRSPYPDLGDWEAPLLAGLQALSQLSSGQLTYDDTGLRVDGVAALPPARDAARKAMAGQGETDILLEDDGIPPRFDLIFDAERGASLSGKLPGGLGTPDVAGALGLDRVNGTPSRAPSGESALVRAQLAEIGTWIGQVEAMKIVFDNGRLDITATLAPGAPIQLIREVMAPVLQQGDSLRLAPPEELPPTGALRQHAATGQPQIFRAGHWLDDLSFTPTPQSCAERLDTAAPPAFLGASLRLDLQANARLATLAALGRACHRFAGLVLEIEGHAQSAEADSLNRQLARRRAEAVRSALIARGVPQGALRAIGRGDEEQIGDVMRFGWAP